jgi:galactokinase
LSKASCIANSWVKRQIFTEGACFFVVEKNKALRPVTWEECAALGAQHQEEDPPLSVSGGTIDKVKSELRRVEHQVFRVLRQAFCSANSIAHSRRR